MPGHKDEYFCSWRKTSACLLHLAVCIREALSLLLVLATGLRSGSFQEPGLAASFAVTQCYIPVGSRADPPRAPQQDTLSHGVSFSKRNVAAGSGDARVRDRGDGQGTAESNERSHSKSARSKQMEWKSSSHSPFVARRQHMPSQMSGGGAKTTSVLQSESISSRVGEKAG